MKPIVRVPFTVALLAQNNPLVDGVKIMKGTKTIAKVELPAQAPLVEPAPNGTGSTMSALLHHLLLANSVLIHSSLCKYILMAFGLVLEQQPLFNKNRSGDQKL